MSEFLDFYGSLSSLSSVISLIVSSIVILAVFLLIRYLISNEFYKAAKMKGHSSKKYLWICFLLGMVGYLLVIALPNISEKANGSNTDIFNDNLPQI